MHNVASNELTMT